MPCSSYLVVACYILYVIKFGNLLLLSLLSLLLFLFIESHHSFDAHPGRLCHISATVLPAA